MNYSGSCLCGNVKFRVNTDIHSMYHCHCSLCRKQSGTAANAATLINQQYFEWTSVTSSIFCYQKETGFRSHFCQRCGSPVPNQVGTTALIWIPLGLLDNAPKIQQKLSFCLSSKITWTDEIKVNQSYAELPEFEELLSYFDQ
ncbi:GFA family protein [Acinetobacter sp. 226]|uniref:GFA family protein n=1 Tax=Acinetobacter sp. 226 TaxID=3114699 RepID=UPI003A845240